MKKLLFGFLAVSIFSAIYLFWAALPPHRIFVVTETKRKIQKISEKPQTEKEAETQKIDEPLPQMDLAPESMTADSSIADPSNLKTFGDSGAGRFSIANGEDVFQSMSAESQNRSPRVVFRGPLEYPSAARSKGLSGYVRVAISVSETGQVRNAQVIESQPTGVFDEVALSAVRMWKYEAGMKNGKLISMNLSQKIIFELD